MKTCVDENEFSIEAIFPNWHNEEWVSYTLKSVLEGISSDDIRIGATVMARAAHVNKSYVHPVMHRYALRLFGKYIKDPMRLAYKASRVHLSANDVAYFWLGSPAEMCAHFRDRGIMVAREMINCTLELRRGELRKAYNLLNLPDASGISDSDILREREDLLATDVIFCPNLYVKASVIAYGFPAERCIETSYGWSEARLNGNSIAMKSDGVFTVAFVGTVDIRKGAPLLLDAWVRSGVNGRLLLAGSISKEVSELYSDILSRQDVVCLGHVKDIGAIYRSADVFCFPTWEEGGPQVTLEAMSFGNVPIVTDMGTAGSFTKSEEIGIVVPPGDVDALGEALRLMESDIPRRRFLAEQAKARSKLFSWDLVGQRRRASLFQQRAAWLGRTGR